MDENNTSPQQTLVDKIKDSKSILVTVTSSPNVDQLAACLGLTLWLNKIDKHATAVFSGEVPSTLEFLKPDETLEKNTDSLRDFIIALDKSKADKLRYKVEEDVVRVFITPYRTSLTADDLQFSQGDFNVDMVIALGVHKQDELDTAITSYGRILHDATVATITIGESASELGSISWHDTQASSLSELVVELGNLAGQEQLDSQIATALLTGIIAETERFSNEKTTPQTMSLSAQLMSAGADQQLVANQLDEPDNEPDQPPEEQTEDEQPPSDGEIAIGHPDEESATETEDAPAVESSDESDEPAAPAEEAAAEDGQPDDSLEPSVEPLDTSLADVAPTSDGLQPAPPSWMPPQPWMAPDTTTDAAVIDETGTDQPLPEPAADTASLDESTAEAAVTTPEDQPLLSHEETVLTPPPAPTFDPVAADEAPAPDVDSARDEVLRAIGGAPDPSPEPVQALNAQSVDLATPPEPSTAFDPASFNVMNDPEVQNAPPMPPSPPEPFQPNDPPTVDPDLTGPVQQPFTLPLPNSLTPPPANEVPPTSVEFDPTAPPPVPPPMMPPR